jgi:xylan 1,4-beta-xylosidase
MRHRRLVFRVIFLSLTMEILAGLGVRLSSAQSASHAEPSEIIDIDVNAPSHAFPHFWEQTFGSGRAILTLRESYRNDLRAVKRATDFQYVRFHAIFHDEVGVYDEDEHGSPLYNFSYVDQIYDGLLQNHVRPFVEISFMPRKLSSNPKTNHPFWYKPNVEPPKDWAKWDELIQQFAKHLVQRYGEDEVARWYFEVWNEPNIDFWAGAPKQETYYDLYDHTARALKVVSSRLRVGGPSTAAADWIDTFLAHVASENAPIDFVSSHGYADDTVENLFHTHEDIPMDGRVCRAIDKVHSQIASSRRPNLPLMWTEWNVPSFGRLHARDTVYVGAAVADDIRQCDGLVNMMSFWTFSDVFEEGGPKMEPFDGGFGLVAMGGMRKPSYAGFALLHKLGTQRLNNSGGDVLVTRRDDGTLVVALWNLVDPDRQGSDKSMHLKFRGIPAGAHATIQYVDSRHGNSLAAYRAMGSPRYPSREQVREVNHAADLAAAQPISMHDGAVDLKLSPDALALLELSAASGK